MSEISTSTAAEHASTERGAPLPRTALAMLPDLPDQLFGPNHRQRFAGIADLITPILTGDDASIGDTFEDVEVLVGCWGAPRLDDAALDRLPSLRSIIYAAGSVKGVVTESVFERGIVVSSAAATNALPVAEYTLGMILLSGKRVFAIADEYVRENEYRPAATTLPQWGNYGLRVGIVGASRIGRRVIELLAPFDIEVLVYDPIAPDDIPGARRVGLVELLEHSDIVSLHAPSLPETDNIIDATALARMRDGTTLINTARGRLVDHDALARELSSRRLFAVIDTTEPDHLPPGHPLFSVPNLVVTPHIAGSQGNELRRLGDAALGELRRWARGERLRHVIDQENVPTLA